MVSKRTVIVPQVIKAILRQIKYLGLDFRSVDMFWKASLTSTLIKAAHQGLQGYGEQRQF